MEAHCANDASEPVTRPAFRSAGVHDVVWAPSEPARIQPPTLSVHAYSPPLTAMSYYDVTARHTLRRDRTELTDKPEGD